MVRRTVRPAGIWRSRRQAAMMASTRARWLGVGMAFATGTAAGVVGTTSDGLNVLWGSGFALWRQKTGRSMAAANRWNALSFTSSSIRQPAASISVSSSAIRIGVLVMSTNMTLF